MPERDDQEFERQLSQERPEPSEDFVHQIASGIRGRASRSAHQRTMLATAGTVGLLVAVLAFGGVGAASSAIDNSTSAVKSAFGRTSQGRGGGSLDQTPAKKQYHQKVVICVPHTRYVVTYTYVTKYKWIGHGKHRHRVAYQVKVRTRSRTIVYFTSKVQSSEVPGLVSKGAVYPVPTGGCSSIHGTA